MGKIHIDELCKHKFTLKLLFETVFIYQRYYLSDQQRKKQKIPQVKHIIVVNNWLIRIKKDQINTSSVFMKGQ